jgi:hypothetical protein
MFNLHSSEYAHLIISSIVVVFLVLNIIYNWKLIKQFKSKITEAYLKDSDPKMDLPPD